MKADLQYFLDAYIGGDRYVALNADGAIIGTTRTESEAFDTIKAARGADGRYGATPKITNHVALNVCTTEGPISILLADAPKAAKFFIAVTEALVESKPAPTAKE